MNSYPPQQFAAPDLDAAVSIARICKFATIIHADGAALTTVHVPLTATDGPSGPRFLGHIARNNPLFDILQAGDASVRLIFLPAEGYVSPQVYAEKANSGKVVPTWNYVAAHLDGELTLVEGGTALLQTLDTQTTDYEAAHGDDWRVGDAPDDYIAAMSKAIVAITFTPQDGVAIEKISQNKPGDLAAIADWLTEHEPEARSLAYWMARK